ncbi:hypothetical protein VCRA2113O118_240055 [Vibrio crassostreae]|nr:hypothetical protein VCRA2113O118_240055 [Vibrio crassostreae]CAK2836888.1 hypothetical protein VCRA217O111_240056 [Vibrio crassostreae]CAK2864839.1 hypothetical protein VCRA217O112_230054 [Vibrio crassostreae]
MSLIHTGSNVNFSGEKIKYITNTDNLTFSHYPHSVTSTPMDQLK